jgi:hypothetical protein
MRLTDLSGISEGQRRIARLAVVELLVPCRALRLLKPTNR